MTETTKTISVGDNKKYTVKKNSPMALDFGNGSSVSYQVTNSGKDVVVTAHYYKYYVTANVTGDIDYNKGVGSAGDTFAKHFAGEEVRFDIVGYQGTETWQALENGELQWGSQDLNYNDGKWGLYFALDSTDFATDAPVYNHKPEVTPAGTLNLSFANFTLHYVDDEGNDHKMTPDEATAFFTGKTIDELKGEAGTATVTLKNFAKSDLTDIAIKTFGIQSDLETAMAAISFDVKADKKHVFTGSRFAEVATGTSANETFNLGAGKNTIDIDVASMGKDVIKLTEGENLTVNLTNVAQTYEGSIDAHFMTKTKNGDLIVEFGNRDSNNEWKADSSLTFKGFAKNPKLAEAVDITVDGTKIFDLVNEQRLNTNNGKFESKETIIYRGAVEGGDPAANDAFLRSGKLTATNLSEFIDASTYKPKKGNKGVTINAAGGNDVIYGSQGNDTITGGAGVNTYHVGAGKDVYKLTAGETVNFADATVRGYERAGNDLIVSTGTDDSLTIKNYFDTKVMTDTTVKIGGTAVDDLLKATTTTVNGKTSKVYGTDYADVITATKKVTKLYAGAGDDTITTAYHKMTIDGGAGDDTLKIEYPTKQYRVFASSSSVADPSVRGAKSYTIDYAGDVKIGTLTSKGTESASMTVKNVENFMAKGKFVETIYVAEDDKTGEITADSIKKTKTCKIAYTWDGTKNAYVNGDYRLENNVKGDLVRVQISADTSESVATSKALDKIYYYGKSDKGEVMLSDEEYVEVGREKYLSGTKYSDTYSVDNFDFSKDSLVITDKGGDADTLNINGMTDKWFQVLYNIEKDTAYFGEGAVREDKYQVGGAVALGNGETQATLANGMQAGMRIEGIEKINISYAEGVDTTDAVTNIDCNAAHYVTEKVMTAVQSWFATHDEKYGSVQDVFKSDNYEDMASLITAYTGYTAEA